MKGDKRQSGHGEVVERFFLGNAVWKKLEGKRTPLRERRGKEVSYRGRRIHG